VKYFYIYFIAESTFDSMEVGFFLLGHSAFFIYILNDFKWVSEKISHACFGLSSDFFELCFLHVIFFSADCFETAFILYLFIYCRECCHVPDENQPEIM